MLLPTCLLPLPRLTNGRKLVEGARGSSRVEHGLHLWLSIRIVKRVAIMRITLGCCYSLPGQTPVDILRDAVLVV